MWESVWTLSWLGRDGLCVDVSMVRTWMLCENGWSLVDVIMVGTWMDIDALWQRMKSVWTFSWPHYITEALAAAKSAASRGKHGVVCVSCSAAQRPVCGLNPLWTRRASPEVRRKAPRRSLGLRCNGFCKQGAPLLGVLLKTMMFLRA